MARLLPVLLIISLLAAAPPLRAAEPEALFRQAVEHFEAGEPEAAGALFRRALEAQPDYHQARFNLAVVYWTLADYAAAAAALEELLAAVPENHELAAPAREHLEQLQEILAPPEPEPTAPTAPLDMAAASERELIDHLVHGVTSRRVAAARQLSALGSDEAVAALEQAAFDRTEKEPVRTAAALGLSTISHPRARRAADRAISDGFFDVGDKFRMLRNLEKQADPEAFEIILRHWLRVEWAEPPEEPETAEIIRKDWPRELHDGRMWELTQQLGRREMVAMLNRAWPVGRAARLELVPEEHWDYITYFGLMAGHLDSDVGARLIVRRLREDYPRPPPPEPAEPAPGLRPDRSPRPPDRRRDTARRPGVPERDIDRDFNDFEEEEEEEEEPGPMRLTPEEETRLRAQIVAVLGNIAGGDQRPFLQYLRRHDPKLPVQAAAAAALPALEQRVARSRENYQRGQRLIEEGNFDEAIGAFELSLQQNPDAEYRHDIRRHLVRAGFGFLARGETARASELLRPLIAALPPLSIEATEEEGRYEGVPAAAALVRGALRRLNIRARDVSDRDIGNLIRLGMQQGFVTVEEHFDEFEDDEEEDGEAAEEEDF